jgi:shikimate kinase
MGSGKTTVGQQVAEALRRPFVDSDAVIEAATGRTVRDIWLADGEPVFRALETEALRNALKEEEPIVIAAAGGIVLSWENREILKEGNAFVVWLTADPSTLVGRAQQGEHRPLLDDDADAALHAMATERESLYRDVADATVDAGERSVDDVARDVVDSFAVADRG